MIFMQITAKLSTAIFAVAIQPFADVQTLMQKTRMTFKKRWTFLGDT